METALSFSVTAAMLVLTLLAPSQLKVAVAADCSSLLLNLVPCLTDATSTSCCSAAAAANSAQCFCSPDVFTKASQFGVTVDFAVKTVEGCNIAPSAIAIPATTNCPEVPGATVPPGITGLSVRNTNSTTSTPTSIPTRTLTSTPVTLSPVATATPVAASTKPTPIPLSAVSLCINGVLTQNATFCQGRHVLLASNICNATVPGLFNASDNNTTYADSSVSWSSAWGPVSGDNTTDPGLTFPGYITVNVSVPVDNITICNPFGRVVRNVAVCEIPLRDSGYSGTRSMGMHGSRPVTISSANVTVCALTELNSTDCGSSGSLLGSFLPWASSGCGSDPWSSQPAAGPTASQSVGSVCCQLLTFAPQVCTLLGTPCP